MRPKSGDPAVLSVAPWICRLGLVSWMLSLGFLGCAEAPGDTEALILEAALAGEGTRVETLVEGDSELIHAKDGDGMTPLLFAAMGGHFSLVEFLLDQGADIAETDVEDRTALHHAAFRGHPNTVRLLLDRGADVGAREFRGRTPLFLATNWGEDLETVRHLIAGGSDVNDRTEGGEEVFFSTLYYGDPAILDVLLDAGARLPEDDERIGRAVYLAASNGFERVFALATGEASTRGIPWWGQVPMHAAARGGSVSIGETLLARGVAVDAKNMYGITPLHVAAEHGRLAFLDFLVGNGASLRETSVMGLTAQHFALENDHPDLAARLRELGASDDAPIFPELRGPWLGQPEPGEGPERFALGIVSGHGFNSEHSPAVFSPDGSEVYWTQAFRGPISHSRLVDGRWSAPAPAPFVSGPGDGEPFFSPDGERLYFLSMRPIPPDTQGGKENIWFVERTGEGWGDPQPVDRVVNEYDHHWEVSISDSGTLYFSSSREGTYGGNDIYRSLRVDGIQQPPENLGPVINTDGTDLTPFIAPDESYLIFASSGHGAQGGFHFFISYRGEDGEWTTPLSLDHITADVEQPLWPFITADRQFLFFIGDGDVWWTRADFIEEMRPR